MNRKTSKWVMIATLLLSAVITNVKSSIGHAQDPKANITQQFLVDNDIFSDGNDSAFNSSWGASRATSGGSTETCTSIYVSPCSAVEGSLISPPGTGGKTYVNWQMAGGKPVNTQSILGICTSSTDMNCVVGLNVTTPTGVVAATYVSDLQVGSPFAGDIEQGIPDGKYAPIFSVPSSNDPQGDKFVVRIAFLGGGQLVNCKGTNEKSRYCKYKANTIEVATGIDFGAVVNCTRATSEFTSYCKDKAKWQKKELGTSSLTINVLSVEKSLTQSKTVTTELPADLGFEVVFRVSDKVSPAGWLAGHISSPTLKQTRMATGYEFAIGGKVAEVLGMASLATCANLSTLPQSQIDAINNVRKIFARSNYQQLEAQFVKANPGASYSDQVPSTTCSATETRNNASILLSVTAPSGPVTKWNWRCPRMTSAGRNNRDSTTRDCGGMVSFAELAAAQGDKVTHISRRWSLQNTFHPMFDTSAETFTLDRCAGEQLVGVVGSNASMYDELPRIDGQTGQLDYQIAAPHIALDGTSSAVGTYSLTVTKELAKCQWGVDPSTTSFTTKVVEGSTEQATPPTVTVQSDDQAFRILVTGFHFSKPKLRVAAKDKKRSATKVVRVRMGQKLTLSKLSKSSNTIISTWYLTSGKCKMSSSRATLTIKARNCSVTVSRYNNKTKKATRQIIQLRA